MLSIGSWPEVDRAKQNLLDISRKSEACRSEAISVLMGVMNKPNLDFRQDQSSYHLWRYGAEIPGELKATEAIDLLISHLNLTNGTFSASMSHQPALAGLIKMGSVAIPKLNEVLLHSPNVSMRQSAVFCIATIGGPSAVRSLQEALPTESDKCIHGFISASLNGFDENGQISDRGKWASSFFCDD